MKLKTQVQVIEISKNTSGCNRDRVRAREKALTNTRDLFQGLSTKLYVPAFTA